MFEKSALDCWSEEAIYRPIITLCKTLDKCLGGGVTPKVITEYCGAPGTGKTQMCLQLCVNVQFPQEVGGIGGRALFIDTNLGFSPHRLESISNHCAVRYKQTYKKFYKKQQVPVDFNSSSIMNNVSYIYCKDYIELLTTIETVKCILASKENVVITNELTTRINNDEAIVCPALGDSLAHKVGQRIILSKQNDNHVAYLAKTYYTAKIGIPFKYADVSSVIKPKPHSDNLPVPEYSVQCSGVIQSSLNSSSTDCEDCNDQDFVQDNSGPLLVNQTRLNDLQWKLCDPDVKVTLYRKRHSSFVPYFSKQDGLVFSNDVNGLMCQLSHDYDANEWRLIIDCSKTSLKAVLLYNGNKLPSLSLAYSAHLKEHYSFIPGQKMLKINL